MELLPKGGEEDEEKDGWRRAQAAQEAKERVARDQEQAVALEREMRQRREPDERALHAVKEKIQLSPKEQTRTGAVAITPFKWIWKKKSWLLYLAIIGGIASLVHQPTRNWVQREGLSSVRDFVTGSKTIPFTLTSMEPEQKVPGCLPQGEWLYEKVQTVTSDGRYLFRDRAGRPYAGWLDKGGVEDKLNNLFVREVDRVGSILVSTDASRPIPTGSFVTAPEECTKITVTPNVWKGVHFDLLYLQKVTLVFTRR